MNSYKATVDRLKEIIAVVRLETCTEADVTPEKAGTNMFDLFAKRVEAGDVTPVPAFTRDEEKLARQMQLADRFNHKFSKFLKNQAILDGMSEEERAAPNVRIKTISPERLLEAAFETDKAIGRIGALVGDTTKQLVVRMMEIDHARVSKFLLDQLNAEESQEPENPEHVADPA